MTGMCLWNYTRCFPFSHSTLSSLFLPFSATFEWLRTHNSCHFCDFDCYLLLHAKNLNKIGHIMTIFGTPSHLHKYFLLLVIALFLLLLQTSDGRKSSRSISTKKSSSRRETATSTSSIPSSPSVAYNLSVVTWNLAEKKPTDQDCLFLKEFRGDDFVVFGVQECENIKPRREEGHRSRAWRAIQKAALGKAYVCLAQHRMGGMQIAGEYYYCWARNT